MLASKIIKFWGFVDICFFIWVMYRDFTSSKIPYYDSFIEISDVTEGFDILGITVLTYISFFVSMTIVVSGVLMFLLKRLGVYLSLMQSPFRLFFLIPPTFFFLAKLDVYLPVPYWIIILAIVLAEFYKIYTEVMWLKKNES